MKTEIYFRADGNESIGLGHIIRSLALVDMLNHYFKCSFIVRNPNDSIKNEIRKKCSKLIVLDETEDNLSEASFIADKYLTKNATIVLDGYHFKTKYQQLLKAKGAKVVSIDDIHTCHFVSDAVINHAPNLTADSYSVESYTELHLGLAYALLRKPFLEAAKRSRSIKTVKHLFLCFGGSDFNNLTYKILKKITSVEGIASKINVVIGSANIHAEKIAKLSQSIQYPTINVYRNLNEHQMLNVMLDSHLAIVPASSILYEIIAVKCPVISGYYVDNQINIYRGFKKENLIIDAGDLNSFDDYDKLIQKLTDEQVEEIVNRQAEAINGMSSDNLVKMFKH